MAGQLSDFHNDASKARRRAEALHGRGPCTRAGGRTGSKAATTSEPDPFPTCWPSWAFIAALGVNCSDALLCVGAGDGSKGVPLSRASRPRQGLGATAASRCRRTTACHNEIRWDLKKDPT